MPKITALIHVVNHQAPALEQTLKTLRPCDEILLIDHNSESDIAKIAEQHRATVKHAIPGVDNGAYALDAHHTWVLCLKPGELLSQELQASLEDWKKTEPGGTIGYLLRVSEQTREPGQRRLRELRLVNRTQLNWKEAMPGVVPHAPELKGNLLRFEDRNSS